MRCPSCRAEVGEQDRFCRSCGGRLAGTDTVRAAPIHPASPEPARRPGYARLLLVILLNLALAAGSALAVHTLLVRRAGPGGTVTLGIPRLIARGQPADLRPSPPVAAPRHTPGRPHAVAAHPPQPVRAPRVAPRAHDAGAGSVTGSPSSPPPPVATDGDPPRQAPSSADATRAPQRAAPEAEDAIDGYRAGLDADSVRMVVQHHLPQVRACYDRALKQKADLAGVVEIRFTITDQGQATNATVHRNTSGHEGLGQCLAITMGRWRYPRPVGGAVEFVYPFVFSARE